MKNLDPLFPDKSDIPASYDLQLPVIQSTYLIDGELKTWSGAMEEVRTPIFYKDAHGESNLLGQYPLMGSAEAMAALVAAEKAYQNGNGIWPSMKVEERIACVRKFASMMAERKDLIVRLLMWEIGKSYADSVKEFDRTITYIQDTIEALMNLDRNASRFTVSEGIVAQIRRAPLGVALCMGPYNYPLNETFTTLIPALIMGNTIIFKPPKMGVLLHEPLLECYRQSFPAGVVNTVYGHGDAVITPIMESGRVQVLAFIGSSRVADILKKEHPYPHRLKSVLGLDAKNPAIVLADANLELTVKECVSGALSFNGQRCTALKIIFVHDSIVNDFVNRLSTTVEQLTAGMPWTEGVFITPLPEKGKIEYLNGLIEDARKKGAQVVNPSGGKSAHGLFFPAILKDVNASMRIYKEEQFGPIIPIVTYHDIEEPLQYVVESNYGQQASIFGEDADEIGRLIDTLVNQVCRVNINSQCQRGPDVFPFTGRKDSAEQTLSVSDALRVFSIRTLVAAKYTDSNKAILRAILKEDKSNFLNTEWVM